MIKKTTKLKYWRELSLDEIIYMHANGNYSLLFLNSGQKLLITKCLKELERKITEEGSKSYLKISRSDMINLRYISDIDSSLVVLKNNIEVTISRRKRNEVYQKINQFSYENNPNK